MKNTNEEITGRLEKLWATKVNNVDLIEKFEIFVFPSGIK